MQKIVTGLLVLCIIVALGVVGFLYRRTRALPPIAAFKWGIILHPNSQLLPIDEVIDDQLRVIKASGAGWVKTDHITHLGDRYNDAIVDSTIRNKLRLIFIIDHQLEKIDLFADERVETRAYDEAFRIASRYKGKIPYYQISSELGGLALKSPTLPGISPGDYDLVKFAKIKDWVRGTLRGIAEADPEARRIMIGHFAHTGFFDLLDQEGLNSMYEAIGWDLYSDYGSDLRLITWSDGEYKLLDKLLTYKKELMLTEVARRDGSFDGKESAVGDYISAVVDAVKDSPVTGLFVYELTDQPAVPGVEGSYGLVRLVSNPDGSFRLGKPKSAYTQLKAIIKDRD